MHVQKSDVYLLILTDNVLVSNLLERRREAAVTLAMLPEDGTIQRNRGGSLIQSHRLNHLPMGIEGCDTQCLSDETL